MLTALVPSARVELCTEKLPVSIWPATVSVVFVAATCTNGPA